MSIDREHQELILLRILGVLLVLVGFLMLAQNVRSDSSGFAHLHRSDRCGRMHVEANRVPHPPHAPHVRALPAPPLPEIRAVPAPVPLPEVRSIAVPFLPSLHPWGS